jgi:hypothetical protein
MTMEQRDIFAPAFGLMLLTFAVWVLMYLRRRDFVRANSIRLRDIATPEAMARTLNEHAANPGNNFSNLLELPTLFYFMCVYLYAVAEVDAVYLTLAWAFVVLRAGHSYVQCTSNRVSRRLLLYALASLALWLMIGRAAVNFVMRAGS